MNRTRYFEWVTERDGFEHEGWRPLGITRMEPGDALTVAHDVIEHFTPALSISGEAEAFGCMMWGRGRSGWGGWRGKCVISSPTDIANNMCPEIAEFLCRARRIPECPKVPDLDSDLLDHFLDIVREKSAETIEQISEHPPEEARIRARRFTDWMRRGFHRADRVWGAIGPDGVSEAFDRIMNSSEVKEYVPDNYSPLWVKLRVDVCRDTGKVDARLIRTRKPLVREPVNWAR